MFFEAKEDKILIRVRLSPNSYCCEVRGIFKTPENEDFLKVNVVSVPEKNKANKELISFLSDRLKIAKSDIEIISGELDRYKKILVRAKEDTFLKLKKMQIDSEAE